MSAEELKQLLSTPMALFTLMLLASLGSAWKQMLVARRSGNGASVQSYFIDNWPETLAMIGHNIIAFTMLIFTDTLNPAAAIGLGYIANDAADAYTEKGRSFSMGPNDSPVNKQGGFARPLALALLLAVSVPAVVMLPGCTSIGLKAPVNLTQRIDNAYGNVTAIVNTAIAGRERGQLTAEEGAFISDLAKNARVVLQAADTLNKVGDTSGAEGRLLLALGILQQLDSYLNGKQVTP
jgi:hypothetical protein